MRCYEEYLVIEVSGRKSRFMPLQNWELNTDDLFRKRSCSERSFSVPTTVIPSPMSGREKWREIWWYCVKLPLHPFLFLCLGPFHRRWLLLVGGRGDLCLLIRETTRCALRTFFPAWWRSCGRHWSGTFFYCHHFIARSALVPEWRVTTVTGCGH